MSAQFRASKQQLIDLKRLTEIGVEQLQKVLGRLNERNKPTLSPQELVSTVQEIIGDDAETLVRPLLSFQGIIRQTNLSEAVVVNGIRDSISRVVDEQTPSVDSWGRIEPTFVELLQTQSVRLATKGMELAYDYANLLQRSKVLTDIRPLFDDEAKNVEGAVVSYTLRLRYSNADGSHELSIALDEMDIKTLISQCERSLTKAQTSKQLLQDQCRVGVTIAGETSNDKYA